MPRRVDHGERRRTITEAVCRLTASGGLAAATFREVAAEAGVSVRLVQYYFGSKGELMLATQRHVAERATARSLARVAAAGDDPRASLRALLGSFIPDDAESRENMVLFVALNTAALVDPALGRPETWEVPDALRAAVVTRLRDAGVGPGVDIDLEASLLVAVVPSLAQAVLGGVSTDDACRVLDYALERALG